VGETPREGPFLPYPEFRSVIGGSFEKIRRLRQAFLPQAASRRFQFDKRSQLVIGTQNVTASVAMMCVRDPDGS